MARIVQNLPIWQVATYLVLVRLSCHNNFEIREFCNQFFKSFIYNSYTDTTIYDENHQFISFDDFPEAPFLDWALDPETGIRYHENKLRFNMEIFDDEFSGF